MPEGNSGRGAVRRAQTGSGGKCMKGIMGFYWYSEAISISGIEKS